MKLEERIRNPVEVNDELVNSLSTIKEISGLGLTQESWIFLQSFVWWEDAQEASPFEGSSPSGKDMGTPSDVHRKEKSER
jgi:hypothetical protein